MKEYYFVNGMPRSGSTLLCNILAQNPDFHSTPTSGLSEMIRVIYQNSKQNPVIKSSESPDKLFHIIKDFFEIYHYDTRRPVIFNKSRGWCGLIEVVENAFQKPIKILTTTRSVPCILSSLEKLYRNELKLPNNQIELIPSNATLEHRINMWMGSDGLVGSSYNTIKDACMRGYKDRFYFIDFDYLTSNPLECMRGVYSFLDKPYYNHDFNNVEQYTHENDTEHGFTNLHIIRSKILPVKDDSKEILGNLYNQLTQYEYDF